MSGDGTVDDPDAVAGSIRRLPESTIRKIAAGEVVERPASVVKELVENSLDAGATRIEVAVDRGGKDRIRVSDDGSGMTAAEARLAVREHTTSKLDAAKGLDDGIATLGFRGEALYAIGAVSTMEVTTRSRAEDEATRIRVDQGSVLDTAPAGRAPGTTVTVTDLFAGMPARRKFLKADATEFDRVSRIVSRYALANPDVAVSLSHDDREIFATPGRGDRKAAIMAVYGREVAEAMLPLTAESVSGYASDPETTRSTREYISTYVNGRYVASSILREAVVEAYGKQLAGDRYPFATVFLDLPPEAVDVNVHPRKLEVRFDDPAGVRSTVHDAVRSALLEAGLVRASAPRGRSRPDEASVGPGSNAPETDGRTTAGVADDTAPSIDGGSRDEPDATSGSVGSRGDADATPESKSDDRTGQSVDATASVDANASPRGESPVEPAGESTADAGQGDVVPSSIEASGREPAPDRKFRDQGTQSGLDTASARTKVSLDRLPPMRVLGQLDDTFLVATTDDGLVLVDQHAADERINYERLRDRLSENPTSQVLANPVSVELTARERAAFPAFEATLEQVGFNAQLDDEGRAVVEAVPAVLGEALAPDRLRDVIDEILVGDKEETSADRRADALISDLACHPSITANTSLSPGSAVDLLDRLDGCENPYACPHGRPTVIRIGREEIDDRFERDYPGHAERRDG